MAAKAPDKVISNFLKVYLCEESNPDFKNTIEAILKYSRSNLGGTLLQICRIIVQISKPVRHLLMNSLSMETNWKYKDFKNSRLPAFEHHLKQNKYYVYIVYILL